MNCGLHDRGCDDTMGYSEAHRHRTSRPAHCHCRAFRRGRRRWNHSDQRKQQHQKQATVSFCKAKLFASCAAAAASVCGIVSFSTWRSAVRPAAPAPADLTGSSATPSTPCLRGGEHGKRCERLSFQVPMGTNDCRSLLLPHSGTFVLAGTQARLVLPQAFDLLLLHWNTNISIWSTNISIISGIECRRTRGHSKGYFSPSTTTPHSSKRAADLESEVCGLHSPALHTRRTHSNSSCVIGDLLWDS